MRRGCPPAPLGAKIRPPVSLFPNFGNSGLPIFGNLHAIVPDFAPSQVPKMWSKRPKFVRILWEIRQKIVRILWLKQEKIVRILQMGVDNERVIDSLAFIPHLHAVGGAVTATRRDKIKSRMGG